MRLSTQAKKFVSYFVILENTFGRVWHAGLMYKLKCICILDKLIDWFIDYLSNRRKRIVLNEKAFSYMHISAGGSQG